MICVQVTCKDNAEAQNIALCLLEKKLIACANIFPVNSLYLWKGKIKESSEYVVVGKTLREKFSLIEKEVKRVHSYEIPSICCWEETVTKDVEDWVRNEL